MMKKKYCCILIMILLCLLLPETFAAEDLSNRIIANGTVAAVYYTDLTAPYSGTLLPFDLEPGDWVEEGELLFELMTITLRAQEEGKISFLFVEEGDDADAAMNRYGALGALEPAVQKIIQATTQGAFNRDENKLLRIGETLYFQSTETNGTDGTGRVIAVNGSEYTVEILSGDADLGKILTLYRKNTFENRDNVGRGKVVRRNPIPIVGSGRVVQINVQPGQGVIAGEAILTLMGQDADQGARPEVKTAASGVISRVMVTPGQQVWKGQVLARIEQTEQTEVIAQVDEIYLENIKVGDVLPVTLDMKEDVILQGTVTEISGLGVTRQNAAYFDVHLSIPERNVPLGASASVYLPRK